MNETGDPSEATATSETPAAPPPAISPEELAPVLRKHVDPGAPVPLRMMAAKLLVPASPSDAACLLYLLSFDPDPAVRTQAVKTAGAMPDRIAVSALRDESVPGPVLAWFADQLIGNDGLCEVLVLNPSTPDEALVQVVRRSSERIAELVSQNQLRILRCEPLLRALLMESRASRAVIDGSADFAIRSGVWMDDVPALLEAHRRIHGDRPPEPPEETAEAVLRDFAPELADDVAPGEVSEERRLTLTQRIMRMSVSEKIKLATLGNKEARTLLLRDTNKLVCVAAIQSPRITDSEVMAMAGSRTVHEEVIRVITRNREWIKSYQVKLNLVRNPKTPLPTALKFLQHIRATELRDLQKNKNVPIAIQTGARAMLIKMKPSGK
jgi:hypothetical protein